MNERGYIYFNIDKKCNQGYHFYMYLTGLTSLTFSRLFYTSNFQKLST